MNLLSKIESILFVASKPLSFNAITKAVGVDVEKVEEAIETLKMKYNQDDSGIYLFVEGDSIQMGTNPENSDAIECFIKDEVSGELTKAQLETLTVIAYRGPITRPELEQIRGVNCSIILRNLIIRGLVNEKESEEALLPAFILSMDALRYLGVTSLNQLPEYDRLHSHEHLKKKLEEVEDYV